MVTSSDITSVAKTLQTAKSSLAMRTLIRGLFTEKEIEEFARRIEIVKMVKKDVPQHKIALTLGVGVATVTRGVREVNLGRFKNI